MGPVVGSLWHDERTSAPRPDPITLDEAALNTIGYVLSRYGALTGADLEILTHGETPWREADRSRTPGTSVKIPVETMRAFFAGRESDADEDIAALPDAGSVAQWLADARQRLNGDVVEDSVESLRARLA